MRFNCTFSALVSPFGIAVRIMEYQFVQYIRRPGKKLQEKGTIHFMYGRTLEPLILKYDKVSFVFAHPVLFSARVSIGSNQAFYVKYKMQTKVALLDISKSLLGKLELEKFQYFLLKMVSALVLQWCHRNAEKVHLEIRIDEK